MGGGGGGGELMKKVTISNEEKANLGYDEIR